MKYKYLLKRIIPFAIALGIGLLLAGFFNAFSTPAIEVKSNFDADQFRELRIENSELKRENCRLKREHRRSERRIVVVEGDLKLPPPPPAPIAPEAPTN